MSTAILLRTLSRKSKLQFGKFENDTVGKLLELKKGGYLAWCYYNLSNISFAEDILQELQLEHRIIKPGKDVEYYEEHRKAINISMAEVLTEAEKKMAKIEKRRTNRTMEVTQSKMENLIDSAKYNQTYNHRKRKK